MNEDLNQQRRENSGKEKLSDNTYFKVGLAASLIALTVFLLIFFKNNPDGIQKIVAEQGENLVSFYTNNLQPALVGSKLNVSDVFNFALNDNLPVDDNKSLYVSSLSGADALELRESNRRQGVADYAKFKHEADLNKEQERRLDSILASYKPQIEKLVLANENNTIAVNSDVWSLNKYIMGDIVRFLKEEHKTDFLNSIMPRSVNIEELDKHLAQMKRVNRNDYVFLTPDTVFTMNYNYTYTPEPSPVAAPDAESAAEAERSRSFEKTMQSIRVNSKTLNEKLNNEVLTEIQAAGDAIKFQFKTNTIPVPPVPPILDDQMSALKEKMKEKSVSFGIDKMQFKDNRFQMSFYTNDGDSVSTFTMDLDLSGLEGLGDEINEMVDSLSALDSNIDIRINGDDSVKRHLKKEKSRSRAKAQPQSQSKSSSHRED